MVHSLWIILLLVITHVELVSDMIDLRRMTITYISSMFLVKGDSMHLFEDYKVRSLSIGLLMVIFHS